MAEQVRDIWDELMESAVEPSALLMDRSTLERYKDCPFAGAACELGRVETGSPEAESGHEGHAVFADLVFDYVVSDGQTTIGELVKGAMLRAAATRRTDLQPDVLDAVRMGVYRIARDIYYRPDDQRRNPADILRFQGGEGERTGQIAYDIVKGGPGQAAIRLTCELDLLMPGDAKDELCLTDWKMGYTPWTAAMVRESFQFKFYSMVLLRSYPKCNRVWVRVWSPRTGVTGWVPFARRDADDTEALCLSAIRNREAALENPDAAECWCYAEKLARCPAMKICPKAAATAPMLAAEPETFLEHYAIRAAQLEADEKMLVAYVKAHGPLQSGGWAFKAKAPSGRAATICLQEVNGNDDAEE
jgi:hypothetical protein